MMPEQRERFRENIKAQWRDNSISGPDEWADACLYYYGDGFAAGVKYEREKCAKIALEFDFDHLPDWVDTEAGEEVALMIGREIRSREGEEKCSC